MNTLDYQALKTILIDSYLTKRQSFKGTKKINEELVHAIHKHTMFLNYNASLAVRVSYIINDIDEQCKCKNCNNLLQAKVNILRSPKYCSLKCSNSHDAVKKQRSETNLERYGISNPFEDTNKIKTIIKEKYGVDNIAKLSTVKHKISKKNKDNAEARMLKTIETVNERYGVNNINQLQLIKDNKAKHFQEKYNSKTFLTSAIGKEIIKQTNLEKFGVENASQSQIVKDRICNTKLARYNDSTYNNRTKAISTMDAVYGTHYKRAHWPVGTEILLNDCQFLEEALTRMSLNALADQLCINSQTLREKLKYFKLYNKKQSQYESFLERILTEYNISFIANDRTILNGRELDFYLPAHNLAFEVNGIFWHSELMGKSRQYHLNKTKDCNEKQINLIHFWDYQFDNNPSLIRSMVVNAIKQNNNRIYARKTQVRDVGTQEYRDFMEVNHIQKSVNAGVKYGLYHNDILVSVMSFGKSRFCKSEYELLRFANLQNHSVVGGASRLFAHFLNNNNTKRVISYANRDISNGKLYQILGFTLVSETIPSYMYFKNRQVYNRMKFQKHKLKNELELFDEELSEWENMKLNGFNRFWNTGNFKYEYK